LPALSVLAILSVIWRWNDFLWPLIVLISDPAAHTIQIGLTTFSGEFDQDHHYILAMTVVALIPITLVFVWLQRFITTGIATTGLKSMSFTASIWISQKANSSSLSALLGVVNPPCCD